MTTPDDVREMAGEDPGVMTPAEMEEAVARIYGTGVLREHLYPSQTKPGPEIVDDGWTTDHPGIALCLRAIREEYREEDPAIAGILRLLEGLR